MKNKKTKLALLSLGILFFGSVAVARADDAGQAPTETVLIRNGDTIIYQGTVDLPSAGSMDVSDNTGATHSINSDSVLGLLYSIDQASDAFSISDLQYYSSFGSLYLKCVAPAGGAALCDNWQYAVNGSTPPSGMDTTVLAGGETVGLYFGSPHQVALSATSVAAGGSFTATAQQYQYLDNTWHALPGVTIGVTVPNVNDPYNPTVVASQAVDASGAATFTLADAGSYSVGISEDYYFPSYALSVSPPVQSGGGGGGSDGGSAAGTLPPGFSVPNAAAYLAGVQNPDGSFASSDMYTDWAAIALAAADTSGTAQANLLDYLSKHATVSHLLTDNERRAMALLALGQNPYSFHGADYIAPIISSFDGTQFGDPALLNDDIFALIPLSSSGYAASDDMIAKDVAFILSKQKPDGSWNESTDMTAAAILALKPFDSISGVSGALTAGGAYLKSVQASDGGFGSVYSTSWAAQAMSAVGASWTKNNRSVTDYFAAQQTSDGAALPSSETKQNRIWATSYAIPAVLGKPWNAIMHAVARPTPQTPPAAPLDPAAPLVAPPAVSTIAPVPAPVPSRVVKNTSNAAVGTALAEPVSEKMPELPAPPIAAAAAKSGTNVPLPVAAIAVVFAAGLGFLSRRFLVKS